MFGGARIRSSSDSPLEEAGFELLVSLQDWCPPCAGPMTRNPVWRVSERLLFSGRNRWFESGSLQRRVNNELFRRWRDASERTLVINPAEAETMRRIFALYFDLGVSRLIGAAAYP